ncbi:MAG: hypothetical protein ABIO39_15370 [Caulobacteraceae bacterium]
MTDATNGDAAKPAPKPRAAKTVAATAAAVQEEARTLADEASLKAAQLKKVVEERAAAAREWASDQTDVLRDTVSTRPLVSVGVSAGAAFAAGLVLGILLTRR